MVNKTTFPSSFNNAVKYVLREKNEGIENEQNLKTRPEILKAQLIQNTDPIGIAEEMSKNANLNLRVKNPCYHASLNFSPLDRKVSNQLMEEAATLFCEKIGFDFHQYIVVKHNDKRHYDHCHIIANRVPFGGGKSIGKQFYIDKAMRACQEIEIELGLTVAMEVNNKSINIDKLTPDQRARLELKEAIKLSLEEGLYTVLDFQKSVNKRGISLEINNNKDGDPTGISFRHDELSLAIKGSQLSKDYSIKNILNQLEENRPEHLQEIKQYKVQELFRTDKNEPDVANEIKEFIKSTINEATDEYKIPDLSQLRGYLKDRGIQTVSYGDNIDKPYKLTFKHEGEELKLSKYTTRSILDKLEVNNSQQPLIPNSSPYVKQTNVQTENEGPNDEFSQINQAKNLNEASLNPIKINLFPQVADKSSGQLRLNDHFNSLLDNSQRKKPKDLNELLGSLEDHVSCKVEGKEVIITFKNEAFSPIIINKDSIEKINEQISEYNKKNRAFDIKEVEKQIIQFLKFEKSITGIKELNEVLECNLDLTIIQKEDRLFIKPKESDNSIQKEIELTSKELISELLDTNKRDFDSRKLERKISDIIENELNKGCKDLEGLEKVLAPYKVKLKAKGDDLTFEYKSNKIELPQENQRFILKKLKENRERAFINKTVEEISNLVNKGATSINELHSELRKEDILIKEVKHKDVTTLQVSNEEFKYDLDVKTSDKITEALKQNNQTISRKEATKESEFEYKRVIGDQTSFENQINQLLEQSTDLKTIYQVKNLFKENDIKLSTKDNVLELSNENFTVTLSKNRSEEIINQLNQNKNQSKQWSRGL